MWAIIIIGVFPEAVVAGFVSNIECYEHDGGEADGETEDVDNRKELMTEDIPPCRFYVVCY